MTITHPDLFRLNKYVILKNMVSNDICEIFGNYVSLQSKYDFTPECGDHAQIIGTHSRYADFLAESLLLHLKHTIESTVGEQIIPCYSYYRSYKKNDKLDAHVDRPACEISATICLSSNLWPFHVANDKVYNNQDIMLNGIYREKGLEINLNKGDGLIYEGTQVAHWREPLANEQHLQVFLHYVRKNGPYASCQFDGRDAIGMPRYSEGIEYIKHSHWMQNLLKFLKR